MKKYSKSLSVFSLIFFVIVFSSCMESSIRTRIIYLDGREYGGNEDSISSNLGVKSNLTLHVEPECNTEVGSKRYQRIFKQLGTKETIQALETVITVDTSKTDSYLKTINGFNEDALYMVVENPIDGSFLNYDRICRTQIGLIFDLHCKKEIDNNGEKKVKLYDFVMIGYRPYDNGFYIEKYIDITEDSFITLTNSAAFKDIADQYISATSEYVAYEYSRDHVLGDTAYTGDAWVENYIGIIEKDDEGYVHRVSDVALKRFTVKITQPIQGIFNINIAGKDFLYEPEDVSDIYPDWYLQTGYRIGGAGYFVSAPIGTNVIVNFNSRNDNTIGL